MNTRIIISISVILILSLLWILPAERVKEESTIKVEVIVEDADYALFTDAVIIAPKSINQGLSRA